MAWPSERVAQGGIFHPARVRYNPETQQLLKALVNESRLSIMQRDKDKYFLRSGEPAPSLKSSSMFDMDVNVDKIKGPKVIIRPRSSKRRSVDDIIQSGAYVREKFVPTYPRVDREMAKKHLQDVMAFGKDVDPNEKRKKKVKKKEKKEEEEMNRFDELTKEIKEREEWLKEMEELGEGEKHRLVIQQQIQARIREMRKLKLASESAPKTKTRTIK